MINNTKLKIPKIYQSKVEEIRKTKEEGYWVYFNKGYDSLERNGDHQVGFLSSQKKVLMVIRDAIKCNCEYCCN